MSTEMPHIRKPWIATTMSLLCPGLGQIYCGRAGRGLIVFCISLICGPTIVMTAFFANLTPMFFAFFVSLLGSIAFLVWAVRDARSIARRMSATDFQLHDYNQPAVYLLMSSVSIPYALGLAFLLRATVIEAFIIPSQSMVPTLIPGDRILVSKIGLSTETFQRGDLVVFRNPQNRKQNFVKRVIGLPGETVEIRDGTVIIDGKPLESVPAAPAGGADQESHVDGVQNFIERAGSHEYEIRIDHPDKPPQSPPIKVADDSYFVLGDHRDLSFDSREIGLVPHSLMVGIVRCIYYPADSWKRLGALK